MNNANADSQNGIDLPVHSSLILYFTRCGCTPPNPQGLLRTTTGRKICWVLVPANPDEGSFRTLMSAARKAQTEGNCRMHDIELVQEIVRADRRSDDESDDYIVRDDSIRLGMVRSERVSKYRVMNYFNARWAVQFTDVVEEKEPVDWATFHCGDCDKFTEEWEAFSRTLRDYPQ